MSEKVIRISCKDSHETQKIGEQICKQLMGNPDFVTDKIHVNYTDFKNFCFILVDEEAKKVDITITL